MTLRGNRDHYMSTLPRQVHRVVRRRYEPFEPAPYALLGRGRFDDPRGEDVPADQRFRMAYCSLAAETAFMEVLQDQRVTLQALARVSNGVPAVVTERDLLREQMLDSSAHPKGVIGEAWYGSRTLASAAPVATLPIFDLTNAASIQFLREMLAFTFAALGLEDFDLSDVTGEDRSVTQTIALWVWMAKDRHGHPMYSGIRYTSRFGIDHPCVALFYERVEFHEVLGEPITPSTPAFITAAESLRLTIR